MGVSSKIQTCTNKAIFALLEGDGSKEEFRIFVEKYLEQNSSKNARLAHQKTLEEVLVLRGDNYMAVVQMDPDPRLSGGV